jgi:cobyrinic acid a,c-diamide synthase
MLFSTPRVVIAGLSGDSGKTLLSLGVARALARRGLTIAPFKKGPDYIDAAWLGAAAGAQGRNLDTFMMDFAAIGSGLARALPADLALVEGNRGLFDGLDSAGSHSTAELAKLLGAPVLLVVDVTKMTRTAAALVQGCTTLDPQLHLAGVLLNRVGTVRQERVIREALVSSGGPPVLGALPRLEDELLPGRHLGLVTSVEHPRREESIDRASQAVETHVDLDALLETARGAPAATLPDAPLNVAGSEIRIGVFRDEALSFYYPENLESLQEAGARLVFVSPLRVSRLPEVDALYFGGGFPEVHVDRLAANRPLREAVRAACEEGMPVYAECGGLMYLARELIVDNSARPMVGVLEVTVEQTARPQGHGYVEAEVDRSNPFFPRGSRLRGHEFHYSRVTGGPDAAATNLRLHRGQGIGGGRDGLVKGRTWASYLHLHALGTPSWARGFVELARAFRDERRDRAGGGADCGEGVDQEEGPNSGPLQACSNEEERYDAQRGGHGVAAPGA